MNKACKRTQVVVSIFFNEIKSKTKAENEESVRVLRKEENA